MWASADPRPPREADPPRAGAGARVSETSPCHLRGHAADVTVFFDPSSGASPPPPLALPVHVTSSLLLLPSPLLSSFPSPWIPTCRRLQGSLSRPRLIPSLWFFFYFLYPLSLWAAAFLGWEVKNRSFLRPVVRLSRARVVAALVVLVLGARSIGTTELELLVVVSGSLRGERG